MSIKVTVLGCWGLATIGETTSFLVQSSRGNVLLDMCPGVTRQLKRLDFDTAQLDIAFGSHVHADHLLGSTYLFFQRSVEIRGRAPETIRELLVVGSGPVLHTIDESIKLHYPERGFDLKTWQIAGDQAHLETESGLILDFVRGDHTAESYGVRITFGSEGKSIAYTADGLVTKNIIDLCRGADLVLGEAFGTLNDYAANYQSIKHGLAVHLGELANHAGVQRILPFHMHPRYGSTPEKKEELLSEIRQNYNGEIVWPQDLLSIDV